MQYRLYSIVHYLNGFGGGGINVGETNDPSKIVGDVGTMEELG